MNNLLTHLKILIKDTLLTSWKVLKLIIPVSIIVKIFDLLGFIEILGSWTAPLMGLIGLPPSFGLIWATTAFANIFSGIYVFLNYADSQQFTVAQVTVLATMMLMAHSLPIELEVASRVGVMRWFMFLLRFGAAYFSGFLLNIILKTGNFLQENNTVFYPKTTIKPSFVWHEWALEQLQNYAFIMIIIFTVMLIMKLLTSFGLIDYLQNSLKPIIKLLGINKALLPMALVGMLLGVVYGAALIIKEKDDNPAIHKKDFVYAMVLLGLCHAIIEDTLLVMGFGASIWGILVFRTIFSFVFTYSFVKISQFPFFKKRLNLITKN